MSTRVLVVDSNREFAILIRQSLEERAAYEVSLATSGEEAISLAAKHQFELAIVDLDLHDFRGAEIIERLRSLQPKIKVVAIPRGGTEDLSDNEQLDVEGVLSKPFYLPDLPEILNDALTGSRPQRPASPQQPADAEAQPAQQNSPPPASSVPSHLQAPEPAAFRLAAVTEPGQAQFAVLLQGRRAFAHVGELSPAQLRALAAAVPELEPSDRPSAVARYLRLPDREQDELLYAVPLVANLGLALVYPAAVPFAAARKEATQVAKALLRDEEASPAAPAHDPEPEAVLEPEPTDDEPSPAPASLPGDWVPEAELSAAQRSMLEEWAELQPPEPDPPATQDQAAPDGAPPTRAPLPQDWVPRDRPPESRLQFAEEDVPTQAEAAPEPESAELPQDARQDAGHQVGHHLPFSAVLVPRFPEHQLTGALARQIREWTHRLCVAWDWRAQEIKVEPDALELRLSLIPERAPAEAVERLRSDLSRRILARYPQFEQDLPSQRFWAREYLLTAGDMPDSNQIQRFIAETRRAQGFET